MILDDIVAWKRAEVEKRRADHPQHELEKRAELRMPRPFEKSLVCEGRLRVLAEIKRASPSAGVIRGEADAARLAAVMEEAGASALSVLTDARYFCGSLDDMAQARASIKIPVLQKDFVIDEYQVWEAAARGADAVLLIVRIIDDDTLIRLYELAGRLSLGRLVETHTRADIARALSLGCTLLAINNRDLSNFEVDISTTLTLMEYVPAPVRVVSQSGIRTASDALRLFEAGVSAIQVGESLMRAGDPGARLRELLSLIA